VSVLPRTITVLSVLIPLACTEVGVIRAARAHDRTQSYSSWQLTTQGAKVRARFAELDLTHFPWGVLPPRERDAEAANYVLRTLRLQSAAGPCEPVGAVQPLYPGPGRVAYEWEVRCPSQDDLRLHCDVLFDIVGSHLHFARVRTQNGREVEKVFHAQERDWALASVLANQPSAPTSIAGYLALGIEHIWGGVDHLAFVIALLLPATRLAELAKVVTGFTVAHSITLTLATLGLVHPDLPSTEALIGLSIALVAVENLWIAAGGGWNGPWLFVAALAAATVARFLGIGQVSGTVLAGITLFLACHFAALARGAGLSASRWGIAFLFGLIHGFGFASALAEVGMPQERLALALGAFNLGVEFGQLAVVLALWPALRLFERSWPRQRTSLVDLASTVVLALGVFWFVSRAYGF
jgi:hypothetical protein